MISTAVKSKLSEENQIWKAALPFHIPFPELELRWGSESPGDSPVFGTARKGARAFWLLSALQGNTGQSLSLGWPWMSLKAGQESRESVEPQAGSPRGPELQMVLGHVLVSGCGRSPRTPDPQHLCSHPAAPARAPHGMCDPRHWDPRHV